MESGNCVVCGRSVFDQTDLMEYYELHHVYMVMNEQGQAVVAAPGTGRDLTFCGAKCLTAYVNSKIAPDAAGE